MKPNEYVLGGNQEIDLASKGQDGIFFVPSESRLSIKRPSGVIITLSGGDLTQASGYLPLPDEDGIPQSTYVDPYFFYLYKPDSNGWHEYETWVKDATGREDTSTNGFDVYDHVY